MVARVLQETGMLVRTSSSFARLLAVLAVLQLAGCATKFGPRTIPGARFDYNETIVRSGDQDLLLNLVRLRYRDTPLFMDLGTVVAQYTFSGQAGISPIINIDGSGETEGGGNIGVGYVESPTITYSPLTGAEFANRILSPIAPATIILLSRSGWSIERLMLCCVQSVNDVTNAPSAAGPTPSYIPDNRQFRKLAGLLRRLQVAGVLRLRLLVDGEESTTSVRIDSPSPGQPWHDELQELRRMLGLNPGQDTFRLASPETLGDAKDSIAIEGRSMLGALYFLSHAVEAPPVHEQRGLVNVTVGPENEHFDWGELTGNLLRIRSQTNRPASAFVTVRYRDHWFYIEDSDLHSKSTFNLLTYLFSLEAATDGPAASPLLTVPVSR